MAKGDQEVEFTEDYASSKKGDVVTFSRDLAMMLIGLKVAKTQVSKKSKPKK